MGEIACFAYREHSAVVGHCDYFIVVAVVQEWSEVSLVKVSLSGESTANEILGRKNVLCYYISIFLLFLHKHKQDKAQLTGCEQPN
jgi:hypothetical protein